MVSARSRSAVCSRWTSTARVSLLRPRVAASRARSWCCTDNSIASLHGPLGSYPWVVEEMQSRSSLAGGSEDLRPRGPTESARIVAKTICGLSGR